jgi:two-component system sensor histidine kinase QseC
MSIRRYLILVIISLLILVVFSAAIHGYRKSISEAGAVLDESLINMAQTLIAFDSDETLIKGGSDNFAFQIFQQKPTDNNTNQLIYHSANTPKQAISAFVVGFHDANFSQQRWRIVSVNHQQRWVFVAHPVNSRMLIADNMILSAMTPLILIMPPLALLIFIIISKGLAPLNNLKKALMKKKSEDLSSIALENVPAEISPIIDTLNTLLTSLEASIHRERRFTGDVAHELRTPISILRINLHNLYAEQGEHSETFKEFSAGIDRLAHVVEQILMLNRVNPKVYRKAFKAINITDTAQKVISELYVKVDEKSQNIALEAEPISFYADQAALEILLQNIISNAIKYTPEHGVIHIEINTTQHDVILVVEDSGQGIPPERLSQVFDRFYRLPREEHTQVIGCGLGLAIVQQIVDFHQGHIELSTSALGGLKVSIRFPKQSSAMTRLSNV